MKLFKKEIPSNCNLYLHGDTHFGAKACHKKPIFELIKEIKKDKNARFVMMGDEQEAMTVDDKRFNIEAADQAVLPIPLRWANYVGEIYEPIKDKCLCWLGGNHNGKTLRYGNITEEMCRKYIGKDVYSPTTAKIQLMNPKGENLFKLYCWHPWRLTISSSAQDYHRRIANMKSSLKRSLEMKASDCLIMAVGHIHKLLICEPEERLIMFDNGRDLCQEYLWAGRGNEKYIEPDSRWYVATGSYLKREVLGIDTYAERCNYDPIELGHIKIEIRKNKVSSVKKIVV